MQTSTPSRRRLRAPLATLRGRLAAGLGLALCLSAFAAALAQDAPVQAVPPPEAAGQVDPAPADPAQADPAQADPAQADPAQADPAQADPAQADPIVLQVGSIVERLSDVEWRFDVAVRSYAAGQGVPYSAEIAAQMRPLLPNYLEQRGTELVLLREAGRRGLQPDEESVALSLERIRGSVAQGDDYEGMLAAAGFSSEERLVTLIEEADLISQVIRAYNDEAVPSENEVRVRYLADLERYTVPESFCARHILVEDEALAGELVARVAAGEDFAALAMEFGTDGTAPAGGDLGCFGRGAMVADFEEAVAAAEVGTVTGPVATRFGYHALLVYEHREAQVRAFDEVRDEVSSSVAAQSADARLNGLLRGSAVVTYPERVPGL